ncbi:MAG: hypothetical protein IJI42_03390 [Methanobrevibacter sp.]|nr:hypothetical protein [Methanobrevibacter sp.]
MILKVNWKILQEMGNSSSLRILVIHPLSHLMLERLSNILNDFFKYFGWDILTINFI